MRIFLVLLFSFFCYNLFFGQIENSTNWDKLIENENFDELKSEFNKTDKSEYSYINFLRNKASFFSQKKGNQLAVKIMQHCCGLSEDSNVNCDTIKINNLHLLARYYGFNNNSKLSLETNQKCLNKRLLCNNVDPIDIAKSYNNIGLEYQINKKHDSSIVYFENAYKYLLKSNNKNSIFTNYLFANYILNLTYLGEIKQAQKLLNEWYKIAKTEYDFLFIIGRTERIIHECLLAQNINGALIFNNHNKKIHRKLYGKSSFKYLNESLIFVEELDQQGYNEFALRVLKEVSKSNLKNLNQFEQLKIKSHIATNFMNLGFDEVSLKIYLELKPKFFENYKDSGEYILLLSNLSICYLNLKDFEKMTTTRGEIYDILEKSDIKNFYTNLFSKNIEQDLVFYTDNENYLKCEEILKKAIGIFNTMGENEKKIYFKLKLTNFYLFQKFELVKSENLLLEIEEDLEILRSPEKSLALYYFYKAEYLRRIGNQNRYTYYKKSMDLFDSLGFYPNEYYNSLKRNAEYQLEIGNLYEGKLFLEKYLGKIDTTNLNYFNRKIDYLFTLKEYQSDDENNSKTLGLLDDVEHLFGVKNVVYRRAANLLSSNIIDKNIRIKVINNLLTTFDSKTSLEYFYANCDLAEHFFGNGNAHASDSVWEKLFIEAKILSKDEYDRIVLTYASHLIYDRRSDYTKCLELLSQANISPTDFEKIENKYYFYCYLGLKDFEKANNYLSEKNRFILGKYSENSEPYFELISHYIQYFEAIGNNKLVKIYREKELDLIYLNQPNNRHIIVSLTSNLVSTLNELNLFESSLFWINRAKNHFGLNVKSASTDKELMLFLSESGCLLNFYLMGGGNEVHLNEITSLLSTIKERCNELKKNSLQSENELMLDVLLKLIEVFFENIEDPTFRSRNSSMNNFYSKLEGSDFKKYLSNDNPNSGVIKLIDEGNFEKAKKQALKENDFGTLEELEWEVGNEVEAFNNRFEDEKLEIHKLINSSKSLTDFELEQTRKIQKNSLNFSLGRYLINFLDPNNEIIKKSFELVLNNYGVLSNLDKDFYHYLRNADSMFKQQYFYLTNLKQQKLINNSQKIENQANLRDLEFNMKRKLLERKNINASWISFEDIQKTLNDSTVFVLNYKYNYKDFVGNSMMVTKQRSYYLTFLITTQSAVPNFILDSLNSDSEQNMIDLYHNQMAKKSETQDLSFVYEKMWSKIDGQLPNKVKKVILSPDGMYNSVNVSTLFDKNNNKYIFDKYEIVIADKFGAKVVDNTSKPSSNVNSAVLVGFPNYAGLTCSDKENTNDSLNLNLDKYYSNAMRGSIAKSLPGTKIEIEKINNLFTKNGIKTTLLMEKNATEDNLKKVLAPDVLHIATHGFFINSKEGTPMFNSGLLLAGSSSKNKKIEDGYLSAYETSLLNLENTRLVVLSACETGRGVMKDGDGVFGLRQGCINAGAQNIIMSLWKVDDKVTQEFMSRFYEIWLNDKTSIREAFNKTQFEIKAKYPQPYYWGAFILVGE